MADKNKEPDNLAQDAAAARAAGMSYGKWKGLQTPAKIEKKEIPEGWKRCAYCGKPFKPKSKQNQKYCESYCGQRARAERDRQKARSHHRDCK